MTTVRELIEDAAAALEGAPVAFGHGTDNAWDEAVALVLGVTELPDHSSSLDRQVDSAVADRIRRLLAQRIEKRVPLAYLLGRSWFAGHEFLMTPGIVVPRSPIGEMIDRQFRPWLTAPPRTVIDLCTGSGCIGIATALAFPDVRVTATDVDPAAVDLARRNAERLGVADRVTVLEGDLYAPVTGRYDLIVSNPPYVDRTDMASLPEEFRHEPAHGLAGGDDGLAIVRRILAGARAHLESGGILVCEVGMSAPALLRAYPRLPFLWPEFEHGGEGVFVLTAADLDGNGI
jgi:ribosomal protein L3 glutamine methyltransferase